MRLFLNDIGEVNCSRMEHFKLTFEWFAQNPVPCVSKLAECLAVR